MHNLWRNLDLRLFPSSAVLSPLIGADDDGVRMLTAPEAAIASYLTCINRTPERSWFTYRPTAPFARSRCMAHSLVVAAPTLWDSARKRVTCGFPVILDRAKCNG